MPDLQIWIAFVIAAEALLILPGPTDMVVVSYALTQGKRSAWASVPGVTLGDATALILSLLGLGAILMASAELFNILKIAGALYLVYLGIKTWRAPVPETLDDNAPLQHGRWRIMAHTYMATALNPGGIVFYVAFFPQFLSADKPLLHPGRRVRRDLHRHGHAQLHPLRHAGAAGAAPGHELSRAQEHEPRHRRLPDRDGRPGGIGEARGLRERTDA